MAAGRKHLITCSLALTLGGIMGLLSPISSFADQWVRGTDGSWAYEYDDGSRLKDGFTPDGYYVDGSGRWWEKKDILAIAVPSRNTFLASDQEDSLKDMEKLLENVQKVLAHDLGQRRQFKIGSGRISCYRISDGTEDGQLFSLSEVPGSGSWTLSLQCGLTKDYKRELPLSWYDYQCLRLILNSISRSGDMLAEAVYYSWEEDNRYGLKMDQKVQVGDTLVTYAPSGGKGNYILEAAF